MVDKTMNLLLSKTIAGAKLKAKKKTEVSPSQMTVDTIPLFLNIEWRNKKFRNKSFPIE